MVLVVVLRVIRSITKFATEPCTRWDWRWIAFYGGLGVLVIALAGLGALLAIL